MMSKKLLHIVMFYLLCSSVACTKIDTIDLPDLNEKSFSSEKVIEKQKYLEKKRDRARELNKLEKSNES